MQTDFRHHREAGFSLLEIIIVISLIVVVYSVALPNLRIQSGSEAAMKLAGLASDIRGAYDMAVLHRKPYRLVFMMMSGEYWLETTDATNFYLGSEQLDRDLTEEEENQAIEFFDEDFEPYVELAGREVEDPDSERVIRPTSPLLMAKERLRPVKWTPVQNSEWSRRSLGPYFLIQDFQAEHHKSRQTFEELGEQARAILYFLPNGYVEKAVIHIAVRKGDADIDETEQPYTVTTNPFIGTANAVSGYEEVNLDEYNEL
jgi:type II secretory pathway pseudopilin PulG